MRGFDTVTDEVLNIIRQDNVAHVFYYPPFRPEGGPIEAFVHAEIVVGAAGKPQFNMSPPKSRQQFEKASRHSVDCIINKRSSQPDPIWVCKISSETLRNNQGTWEGVKHEIWKKILEKISIVVGFTRE